MLLLLSYAPAFSLDLVALHRPNLNFAKSPCAEAFSGTLQRGIASEREVPKLWLLVDKLKLTISFQSNILLRGL